MFRNKMKPLLIAHAEDPDGILARALMMRLHQEFGHIFVRYDRIVEAFEQAVEKSDHVYIADVDLNPRLRAAGGSDFALLKKITGFETSLVTWFDHHDGALKNKDKLAEIGIRLYHDSNQCAALLIAQHYFMKDQYDRRLAKIAQAHDYMNNSSDHKNIKIGKELEKIIAVANEKLDYGLLLELSEDLRDERCFDAKFRLNPKWQSYVDLFNQRETAAYQELEGSVEIEKGEHKVLFGYSSPLLSQKPGSYYLRQKYEREADIFVCLFKSPVRNHIILINEGVTFPVVPFLQSLGGGGRGNGGGFSLDYDITPENYAQEKEMLLSKIEDYQSNSA